MNSFVTKALGGFVAAMVGEFWYNESERYKALVEKSTTKEI